MSDFQRVMRAMSTRERIRSLDWIIGEAEYSGNEELAILAQDFRDYINTDADDRPEIIKEVTLPPKPEPLPVQQTERRTYCARGLPTIVEEGGKIELYLYGAKINQFYLCGDTFAQWLCVNARMFPIKYRKLYKRYGVPNCSSNDMLRHLFSSYYDEGDPSRVAVEVASGVYADGDHTPSIKFYENRSAEPFSIYRVTGSPDVDKDAISRIARGKIPDNGGEWKAKF